MTKQEQVLNWKADMLEGKINDCIGCNDIDSNFECIYNVCKYQLQYNEIVGTINNRTKAI